jgi:hydroxymethylglutaryl-CoA lyase
LSFLKGICVPRQAVEVHVFKIVECPRDAWQGLPVVVPPEVKAAYLKGLADSGFRHIDAVSFVSPAAVPQMANPEEVLRLFHAPEDMEIIGIVVNLRGAERAIATGKVQTLGFPYSVSPGFLERNQRQTPNEALRTLVAITDLAYGAGLDVVAYISMAFGNPYGEAWSSELVTESCVQLDDIGIKTISLADTVGVASADTISRTVAAVLAKRDDIEVGVHLHARLADAAGHIRAAYEAGCRRFDSAIGGLGGCPFAQDELVGNVPTELLIQTLEELGAEMPKLGPLDVLIEANAEIARSAASVTQ